MFRLECWADRRTYRGKTQDKLADRVLKEKWLGAVVETMVGDIEELMEMWKTLDICYNRPEKYIAEASDPIVKFRKYKVFS
jgi:hypothetical protein